MIVKILFSNPQNTQLDALNVANLDGFFNGFKCTLIMLAPLFPAHTNSLWLRKTASYRSDRNNENCPGFYSRSPTGQDYFAKECDADMIVIKSKRLHSTANTTKPNTQ